MSGRRRIEVPTRRRPGERSIELRGIHCNNLRGVDASLPRGVLCCVTGVSGSGKSSLVMEALAPAVRRAATRQKAGSGVERVEGLAGLAQCVIVDQSPIGTSPKSNPATYVGVFDRIRSIMSEAPLARLRGFGPGRFSFNTVAGRCAACAGRGSIKVEMHFLPDVWITCEVCKGRRYDRETLAVEYRGRNVADILDMEVSEAVSFFANHRPVAEPLALLDAVGLGYLKLGQPATTLSGGEAQRIKLARELARRSRGEVLYLLDEPTSGLHLDDVEKLVRVLQRLVDQGHSVVVIEHNLEVIKTADWVIDLGPEGGDGGGRIIAAGTPEEVAASAHSFTGAVLAPVLARGGATIGDQQTGRLAESAK
jgi:excinuclease ABC subunit A